MVNLNLENLSLIDSLHGLKKEEIFKEDLIQDLLEKIHLRKQGFYNFKEDLDKINEFYDLNKDKFNDIVVLGIGGSALGTITLAQSLKHLFVQELSKTPKLHVIDNIDPELITELEDIIDYSKTLFIVVTKSGSTPETLSQFFYYKNKVESLKLKSKDHFIFITDNINNILRKIGEKEEIKIFDVPANIGGRFSVLTNVGLIPAKFIGIDIEKLISGSEKMKENFLSTNVQKNLCFQIAQIQYQLYQKGKSINVMMPYAQKLIKFADWYRQLLAESIGKAVDNKGGKVNIGITPVNALGATDQHSQNQLYNEGPNDKFFMLIAPKSYGNEVEIPIDFHDESIEYLKNVSFNKLITTEMHGTIGSLSSNNRPNILIEIDKIDEEHLGALFMLFEGATAFLGEMFNINAFDQPGVELSKKLTKELLLKK